MLSYLMGVKDAVENAVVSAIDSGIAGADTVLGSVASYVPSITDLFTLAG
jgi:hypothetical protein